MDSFFCHIFYVYSVGKLSNGGCDDFHRQKTCAGAE